MRKIRSKLKRKSSNAKWRRGQSSTSNPTKTTFRDQAKAKLLNLPTGSGLTEEALQKLNKQFGKPSPAAPKVPTQKSNGLESMMDDDEDESVYSGVTTTVASFMSNFSTNTNASFSKLLNCENLNERRKEMVAVLAASTETIKEQGGKESSTEYFVVFINSLAALEDVERADAIVGLLTMVIKAVPRAVLQSQFSLTQRVIMKLMSSFDTAGLQAPLIDIIFCAAVLLAAQEVGKWATHPVVSLAHALLQFTVHQKPKLRKGAVRSTLFMLKRCQEHASNCDELTDVHLPSSKAVTEFCLQYFNATSIDRGVTTVLHVLGLIESSLCLLHSDDVKTVCEGLLAMSTTANVLIRMHCYQALYSLFDAEECGLSDVMAGKLIAAIFDLRPDVSDVRQTIAWITVLKKGYVHLSKRNLTLCAEMLPRFMQILVEELWPKDQDEIRGTVTNTIREVLLDVGSLMTKTSRSCLVQIIDCLTSALKNPFGSNQKQIIITFCTVYEVLGENYSVQLKESLTVLGSRYDPDGDNRREIENAILAAVKFVEISNLLKAIPLTDAKGQVSIEQSWMLPLLREGLRKSSLEYFNNAIVPLASSCLQKWKSLETAGKTNDAHIYELLCCQLWGLFPGFCREPRDVEKFSLIARTAGMILADNLYLRAPILDGFKELIPFTIAQGKETFVGRYAKNYLPILFNLYINKPKGSYENDLRVSTLEVIKLFLRVTAIDTLNEMFATALQRLKASKQGEFTYNMLYDIIECFSAHLRADQLNVLYDEYVKPILQTETKKGDKKDTKPHPEAKKVYRILNCILSSANDECVRFTRMKLDDIIDLVLQADKFNVENLMLIRLRCLKNLLDKKEPDLDSELIRQSISETVLCFPNQPDKPNQLCIDMIKTIGTLFLKEGRLDDFAELVLIGIASENDVVVKTVWAINSVIQLFCTGLSDDTLNFILENVFASVQSNQRMEAKAALCTLYSFAKCVARPKLTANLEAIVKHMSKMVPDTKRFSRIPYGRLLKKLCTFYTVIEITRLVPGNDLVTHKRLKKIRKDLNRTRRQEKEREQKLKTTSVDDDAMEIDSKLKTITIDDVLKDSDSEFSDSGDDDGEEEMNEHKGKKMEVCIREDADTIVDLADADAVNKISMKSKKSKSKKNKPSEDDEDKTSFKVAPDGRLIIEEPKKQRVAFKKEQKPVKTEPGKRPLESSDSESDVEDDTKTQKSALMQQARKKQRGIHRNVSSGASVASGWSGKSFVTQKSQMSNKSFRNGKGNRTAKVDKKMMSGEKKQKMQPYAYIPLNPHKGQKKRGRH